MAARLTALEADRATLTERWRAAEKERDEYKRAYVSLLEAYKKLEAGLVGPKRERFVGGDEQLAMSVLGMLTVPDAPAAVTSADLPKTPAAAAAEEQRGNGDAPERKKPTGRKPLPAHLPRLEIESLPLEVQRLGLDAFDRIGEDVTETVEERRSALVVVRTIRPKFVPKGSLEELAARAAAAETAAFAAPMTTAGSDPEEMRPTPSVKVLQAPSPDLPIPRGICGPALLASTIVLRWLDHMPLHRLERKYGREGFEVARSTICGWHAGAALLAKVLVDAMWKDALSTSPYLCMDATGVLVQDKEKCRRAHFFVTVAPGKHVLFGFSPKHDSAAVDKLLPGYEGFLVADAHSVYDHLYADGRIVESNCWAHARRYWFKALETDSARARHGLALIQALFRLERAYATSPPEEKLRRRAREAKPIVDAFFRYCDEESLKVLDETPIAKAIGYARNQREGLSSFLADGRLPIHNNFSENELRREALGRRNWLFLGSDEGGAVNATFVSLIATCQMHGIEPQAYLRDLMCLLPNWPARRVLELAPAFWNETTSRPEVRALLDQNPFRRVALGLDARATT